MYVNEDYDDSEEEDKKGDIIFGFVFGFSLVIVEMKNGIFISVSINGIMS